MTKKELEHICETKSNSKNTSIELAEWIAPKKDRIVFCWELIKRDEEPTSRRAAYVLDTMQERKLASINFLLEDLVYELPNITNNSIRRHITRMIMHHPISENEEIEGLLAELCFSYLIDAKVDVAVKANSLGIVDKLCGRYPELSTELVVVLQDQYDKNTAAFQSRAKKLIKKYA